MEIVSGMNNSAVQRLKRLWVSLPEKHTEQFEELEELMMPQNNFKNYYTELSKRNQPVLPYFGM
jgi:muramidase (phage lysozyme)